MSRWVEWEGWVLHLDNLSCISKILHFTEKPFAEERRTRWCVQVYSGGKCVVSENFDNLVKAEEARQKLIDHVIKFNYETGS